MRIVVCEFTQETNSFSPVTTTLMDYERGGIYEGDGILKALGKRPHVVGGILQAIKDAGAVAIPAYAMYAQSGGPVEQKVLDLFLKKTLTIIRQNAPVDGVFISMHGATQTTQYDDACGFILDAIRKETGDSASIAIACDLHANITKKMMKNADIICGYHTYPHEDYYETGYRAGKLGIECINGKTKPKMVGVSIPMIVSAGSYSTISGPFAELIKYGETLAESQVVDDFSVFQMQPWLDVEVGGSMVIVISKDADKAERYVIDLATRLFNLRNEFKMDLYSIDEVIGLAEKNTSGKPVILVDAADSTNAGAAGDSAAVLHRLLETKTDVKAAIALDDAKAVELAQRTGVGKKALFNIGGTKDPKRSVSVQAEAYVKSLHEGIFYQEGPAGRGMERNIGRSAVISIGNFDILVCYHAAGNGDPQLYRAFGIEPTFYQLVVVKACTSFRAAYSLFAEEICSADTPGAASMDLKSLNFKRLPSGFYPFSDLNDYEIKDIIYARA